MAEITKEQEAAVRKALTSPGGVTMLNVTTLVLVDVSIGRCKDCPKKKQDDEEPKSMRDMTEAEKEEDRELRRREEEFDPDQVHP